jgi:hypothetical protein
MSIPTGDNAFLHELWAITLFPRGFDQVIPQVLALFLC